MAAIETHQMSAREAFEKAASYGRPASREAESATGNDIDTGPDGDGDATTPGRTVSDTVSLSESGRKIVNLKRGEELAETLKDAPVDASFVDGLRQATQDVFRVMELFSQTVRSAFGVWRG